MGKQWHNKQTTYDINNINVKLSESLKALSLKTSELELEKRKYDDMISKINLKEKENEELKRQRERDEKLREDITKKLTEKQKHISEMVLDDDKKSDELESLTTDLKALKDI